MTLRRKFTSPMRCDFCHRPFKEMYDVTLGAGVNYKLHSSQEVQQAQKNFDDNVAKGLTPNRNDLLTTTNDFGSVEESNDDNI